jgi:hypothetical protein
MKFIQAVSKHWQTWRLTAEESVMLRETLAPLLRDLRASGAVMPDIDESGWDTDPDVVSALIIRPGMSQWGIRLRRTLSAADRLADLADQVQEWQVEELWAIGRGATWPECPEHPNSHPLSAGIHGDDAVWTCLKNRHVICHIGELRGLS